MPRTNIPISQISRSGLLLPAEQAADVANGNDIEWREKAFLLVRNSGGVSYNVSQKLARQIDGQTPADKVVAVGAGETKAIGPFPLDYRQGDGKVWLDFGNVALMVRALEL